MLEQQESRVLRVKIEEELKTSFLDYSMSFIRSRALPDVRDGLKPSQRRILVAMNDLSLFPNRGYRKCAKIAGDTSGNYHPHGEDIVYPTLVHMAQSFRLRYPLVQGQGNFGSIDGYPPAAMRYTEARLSWPAMELLADLDKNTVEFASNYDETQQEPLVLPSRFPNLICNGSMGIAVGMATKIPPHNLREVASGLKALIDHPDISIAELLDHVKAPDFPTGGIIYGMSGVQQAYATGRGLIYIRARADIETLKNGRENIVVTEIPFLVNKASLLEKIADLVRDKTIDGLANIRDESGRKGLRIVFECKREAQAEVVLNQLYSHSMLQTTYGVMMLAIVNGRPETLNLKQMLQHYIDHRHEMIVRRTQFDLERAEARAHILEGLRFALDHIDLVIETIRRSSSPADAQERLASLRPVATDAVAQVQFELSERQIQAILSMPLQRLTGLERDKIEAEYKELVTTIEDKRAILASRERQMQIIKDEIDEMAERFGDERRTEIVYAAEEFDIEDLIAEEDMVVTISRTGYIKRLPPRAYRVQNRGGRGVTGMKTKEEDFVEHLFVASTHSYIMFLTAKGKCYWLKVFRIPEGDRTAQGRSIANLLPLEQDDQICAIVPVQEFSDDQYLFTATRNGIVKKTRLSAYQNIRRDGIIALKIQDDDDLIGAAITDGQQDIALLTRNGQAMRFSESEVRAMGRVSTGVKGISLRQEDEVVDMVVVRESSSLLTICENGYGKRTSQVEYPCKHRGGQGVIDIKTSPRNGPVVACREIEGEEEVMLVTQNGIMIRIPVQGISTIRRNTQGVRVINLDEGDRVIDMAPLPVSEDEGEEETSVENGKADEKALG
ncbi:MAG: DNA gyrase subunit A [Gemmatimonadetes bacterium]|nr:DNA gyrase subunit A [Gemmatimonadota bacterium]MYC73878.1 DNA gyrase subunit A [Gemmatimonadota bacterium]MYI62351.1 DNA gyrase subunit A [Gemmatimonadota bacterium]